MDEHERIELISTENHFVVSDDIGNAAAGELTATPLKRYVTFLGNRKDGSASKWICNFGCKKEPYTGTYSRIRAHLIGLLPGQKAQGVALCSKQEAFEWTTSADTLKRQSKHMKLENSVKSQARKCFSCSIEFDGASKGNPGLSGAGAVIRADDGSLVCRVREGVGIATNNVAEYRAIILGLRHALKKGFTQIRVQGDSKLVCMQVQGLWKTKNDNMAILCKQVKELVDKFVSFQISHVLRV
ncbi:hypothetical protein IFM89_026290 [Coptis chinensis]|uniref:RNase H type-1 domain-containing protein n=1 Tax=Coptis chinensis TaxID=261450 RepID=A0A835IXP8_9MAGN|nr:hypothetical protein IFM89_026290 [Coptis chinensis]